MNYSRADWRRLLDAVDGAATASTVGQALSDAADLADGQAYSLVEDALAEGPLVETDTGGMFPEVTLEDGGDPDDGDDSIGGGREKGGSPASNPTREADNTAGKDALADALRWFSSQLDQDLPEDVEHDTPRDYFRARGWSDATIDAKRLGYAPPNAKDQLVAHLHRKGHDREAILASGLVREWDDGRLSATWSGRYVLPYLDADGTPAFAISRRTEPAHPDDWAGRYDEDDEPAKYHKLPKSREGVTVDEPIYGLDTVEPGEPVLITEGIADAITAHQAGYACISPVTTSFKKADRDRLVETLEARGVSRVYVIQDAERPTSDVDDRGRLTLQQHGEGVKGAVRTAAYLSSHGVDARIGDLPRAGLDKVDLDDYLTDWNGDLQAVLASARPVEEHPAYDPEDTRRAALDAAEATQAVTPSNGEGSALFDLDITDLAGVADGFRGKSPLGHHGESENYFVVEDGLAYDHKYKTAYNALTYLLVDAGERDPDRPNGRLDDTEVFVAWKQAKDERILAEDDPIPRRALQHIARECTDWSGDFVEHETRDGDTFDGLPSDVYRDALDALRTEHDLDPGRATSGRGDSDADPVAALPIGALDALAPDERRRYARKRGLEIPSTDTARDRLRDAVFRELRAGNTTVLDAPTALGKSYTVSTEPWLRRSDVTGEAPVVHLHATKDARDEALADSRATSGVTTAVLRGRQEASPLARGDHDPVEDPDCEAEQPDQVVTIDGLAASDWFDRMCDERGLPFSTALALARDRNDQGLDELPPFGEDDPAVAQWDGLPREDGDPAVDVIHATHPFAYVPSLRGHTNVILDEQPDFREDISQDRIRRMVTAYLQAIDAPVATWEAFVSLARFDGDGWSDAQAEQDALDERIGDEPGREWYVDDPDAHALATGLTQAIWNALRWEEPNRNGRRASKVLHDPPRFDTDASGGYGGTWLSVVIDEENTIQSVRNTPDFTQARAVIGLDAHPSMPMWQVNGPPGIVRDAVLDATERRLWRRYERGLTVVQIGDAARPRSGDSAREWMNEDRVRAIVDALREGYGEDFTTALSTIQTKPALRRILADALGVSVEDVRDQLMHYGAEKSRNDFGDERAGYVYGCMDPGDGMILDVLAELGLDATPATVETEDGEEKREKGRTFEGADADKAAAVLASVRENHVAQAAGRYARNPDDPESQAVVYVDTNAAPAGFVDVEAPGVEWLASDLQREIIDALAEQPSATARELADTVECTKEHVRETLQRLADRDLVTRTEQAGAYGADVYRDAGADGSVVDVGETANDPLCGSNRWSLAIRDTDAPTDTAEDALDDTPATEDARAGGDGPPDRV